MYKSIIDIITSEPTYEMDGEIFKAVQRYVIDVDKEELFKALRYDRDQYNKGYQDGLNADKWIPCSERLPKENEHVLICNNRHDVYVGYYNKEFKWYYQYGAFVFADVIAWQPLPEPYKGEQE